MAETEAPETREFYLPITVTVGDRQLEIPLTVRVSFDQLVEIVNRHLNEGGDIYADLLELLAASQSRETGQGGGSARSRERKSKPPRAPEPEAVGAAAATDGFSDAELDAVDLADEPRYTGRGMKSHRRRLWEAARMRAITRGELAPEP